MIDPSFAIGLLVGICVGIAIGTRIGIRMPRLCLVALATGLAVSPAWAAQIDVVVKFADLATALADPVVQQHVSTDAQGNPVFQGDHVIPDIKVWRVSQDVAGTTPGPDGQTIPTVTHTYLPGYFALISLPQIVPALRDHPAVQVVINRDTNTVIRRGTGIGLALLNDMRFAPIYAGATYPWGAWQ